MRVPGRVLGLLLAFSVVFSMGAQAQTLLYKDYYPEPKPMSQSRSLPTAEQAQKNVEEYERQRPKAVKLKTKSTTSGNSPKLAPN